MPPEQTLLTVEKNFNANNQDRILLTSSAFTDIGIYDMTLRITTVGLPVSDYLFTVTVNPCPLDSVSITPATPVELTVTLDDPASSTPQIKFEQVLSQCPGHTYPDISYSYPTPLPVFATLNPGDPTVFDIAMITDVAFLGTHEW